MCPRVRWCALWDPLLRRPQDGLAAANYAFTAAFALELAAKLFAMGPRLYFSSKFNVFDCVVVVLSVAEIGIEQSLGADASSGLSALRSFRLLRVFRLAKTWKDFQVCAMLCVCVKVWGRQGCSVCALFCAWVHPCVCERAGVCAWVCARVCVMARPRQLEFWKLISSRTPSVTAASFVLGSQVLLSMIGKSVVDVAGASVVLLVRSCAKCTLSPPLLLMSM
jgi:hypothetical protein